jgi:hypothetical protein
LSRAPGVPDGFAVHLPGCGTANRAPLGSLVSSPAQRQWQAQTPALAAISGGPWRTRRDALVQLVLNHQQTTASHAQHERHQLNRDPSNDGTVIGPSLGTATNPPANQCQENAPSNLYRLIVNKLAR